MKNVVVLGSTGSIGTQALEVIKSHPEQFRLLGISGKRRTELLAEQIRSFRPSYVAGPEAFPEEFLLNGACRFLPGEEGTCLLASLEEADIVVNGISGFSALAPLSESLKKGKTVALANKESIVCGKPLIRELLDAYGGTILPVDSEQSAIFQCMNGEKKEQIRRLILTASGGRFFRCTWDELKKVTVEQALSHPTWSMGSKITIDSSTLFNKGLEIMEAAYLFDIPGERIDVLIHPQSIVHSMVEYEDGTVFADMSTPDMRLPIQYAMTYPDRIPSLCRTLDLAGIAGLTFFRADPARYPAIRMAYECLRRGGGYPTAYNAANEAAVAAFVQGRILFTDIYDTVDAVLQREIPRPEPDLKSICECDRVAREFAESFIGSV